MIKARFFTEDHLLCGYEISGHSGSAESGQDVICAFVSSAAYMAANTLSEKRKLIRLAIVHAEGADDGYEGVTEAKAALADAVAAFEAEVSRVNKAIEDARKVAQTVASGVAGGNIFH